MDTNKTKNSDLQPRTLEKGEMSRTADFSMLKICTDMPTAISVARPRKMPDTGRADFYHELSALKSAGYRVAGIVIMPLHFEGENAMAGAAYAATDLERICDVALAVQLQSIADQNPGFNFNELFEKTDSIVEEIIAFLEEEFRKGKDCPWIIADFEASEWVRTSQAEVLTVPPAQ